MRWYSIVSLFSNSRVRFLFGFVIVAIIVAAVLTFIEISLKKKKISLAEKEAEDIPISEMQKFLKSDKIPREKLDFVDKTAKEYFRRIYGTPVSIDYSILIERFEKNSRKEEVVFCKAMFGSYYSDKELTNNRVMMLGSLFVDIVNGKKRLDEIPRSHSVFEKVEGFLSGCWRVVGQTKRKVIKGSQVQRMRKVGDIERGKLLKINKKKEEDDLSFEGGVASRIVDRAKKLY